MKVYFKTFGCRTNIYDSEFMKSKVKSYEVVEDETEADIVVVNSCTVTNGANSDVRNYINRVKRVGKKVLVTGCGAVVEREQFFKNSAVFGLFSPSKKSNIDEFLQRESKFIEIDSSNTIDSEEVFNYSTHSKGFIKIQEGCNFNCSYCIIPAARGKARSSSLENILLQANALAQNGFSELVLTGTNIGSYGKDRATTLAKLLKELSLIKGIRRIRLGSLEPSQIDDEFMEILGESWLEKHLHIALQHTDEEMLKIMRRRNNVKRDLELFNKIASYGFGLGTDFIVGHPGENEQIWSRAVENFKKFPLTHLHAFVFSRKDGTHSATLKQDVDKKEAKKRLNLLKNIVKVNNYNFRKEHKFQLEVLIESKKEGYYSGYDQFYNRVFIESQSELKGWQRIENYEIKFEGNFAKI